MQRPHARAPPPRSPQSGIITPPRPPALQPRRRSAPDVTERCADWPWLVQGGAVRGGQSGGRGVGRSRVLGRRRRASGSAAAAVEGDGGAGRARGAARGDGSTFCVGWSGGGAGGGGGGTGW